MDNEYLYDCSMCHNEGHLNGSLNENHLLTYSKCLLLGTSNRRRSVNNLKQQMVQKSCVFQKAAQC